VPEALTFADLESRANGSGRCRRCPEPVTAVVEVRALVPGKGKQILAKRTWRFCELHAVELFEKLDDTLPGG